MLRFLVTLITALCLSVLTPVHAAPLIWAARTQPLPAMKQKAPFPWIKAPDGRGEFILFANCAWYRSNAQRIGERTFLATTAGVLCVPDHAAPVLMPAVYGQPAAIVGASDGLLWVQRKDFSLLAIDPLTFMEQTRIPSPGCPCFHIETSDFWCFDNTEMSSGALGKPMKNRRPVATAIIEYDRAGKEKRRFVPGKDFPEHTQIFLASVDADAVWVQAAPFISESPTRHTREYGAVKIYRIERTSGIVQELQDVPDLNDWGMLYYLPDRLAWVKDGRQDEKPALLDQLDKKTLAVSQKVQLPESYSRGGLFFQGHYVWCCEEHAMRAFWIAPGEAVAAIFDLNDGHRIHAGAAGQPPCELTVHVRAEDMLLASGNDAARVWVIGGKTLYELRDDGTVVGRIIADADKTVADERNWGQPLHGLFLFKLAEKEGELHCLDAQAGSVTVYASEIMFPFLAATDEQRAWFWQDFGDKCRLFTFGKNLPVRNIPFPHPAADMFLWGESVAIGDELFVYCGGDFYRANAHTGTVTRLASWQAQKPAKLESFYWSPTSAFALPGKKIAFNMIGSDPWQNARVVFDPATDKWTCLQETPEQRALDYDWMTSPHGVFSAELGSNTLWQATETGWTEAGSLPFPSDAFSSSQATEKYLYINSPVGLYRIAWSELLKP